MKQILKMAAIALLVMLGSSFRNDAVAQNDYYEDDYYDDRGDVSYQTFYDELSPHGNWVEYPGYGYVWQPRMGNDFRPYSTGGHWVWSDRYEWVWVSDYDWGWAPFHYGRWMHDPYYGWLWVPGYEWSGAWVSWRDGGDYYGWAPLRPGISFNNHYNMDSYSPPVDWWSFTPRRYILYRNVHNHCIDYRRNVTIINYTTIINNYYYGDRYGFRTGPRRNDFERYTGRINPVQFRQSDRPGRTTFRDNEVSIYRPSIRQDNDRVAPRTFDRFDRNAGSNETQRNIDTRVRSNDNNNDFRNRSREVDQPSNNFPRERTSDRRFEKIQDQPRTQDNQPIRNNPSDNRRFERNTGDNSLPRNHDTRSQKQDQPVRTMEPRNGNEQPRRFERRDNGNNDAPVPSPQVRSREIRPQQQTVTERQPTPQVDRRRQSPEQPRIQQMPARQFERKQQPQPRQMEGRDANGNSGNQQGNTVEKGNGNANEQGNRRF